MQEPSDMLIEKTIRGWELAVMSDSPDQLENTYVLGVMECNSHPKDEANTDITWPRAEPISDLYPG